MIDKEYEIYYINSKSLNYEWGTMDHVLSRLTMFKNTSIAAKRFRKLVTDVSNLDCSVYGKVHYVRYNDMQFFLGQSQSKSNPHPKALHYLIPPGLLVISEFKLLEDINPQSIE